MLYSSRSVTLHAPGFPSASFSDTHSGTVSAELRSSHEPSSARSSPSLPAGRPQCTAGSKVPHTVRRERLSEPRLPRRLRARPLQLLPGLRARRGRSMWPQGRPAVRGRAGVQTLWEAAGPGRVPVQTELRGVRQRREDVWKRVPAAG